MMTSQSEVAHLDRGQGRIAFDVAGDGPLVVCVPGMGDIRQTWRHLTPALVAAGFRVSTMDLRGHGESNAGFDSYDDVAAAGDVRALIEFLGGPAIVVGNSMGAAAAALAAAERPDLVSGLVLVGPFVRNVPTPAWKTFAFRLALAKPWGPLVWPRAYRSLHKTTPPDLAHHLSSIRASLRRPDAWRAFATTTRTSHAPVEARLDDVKAPTLVVMGAGDPDFADPAAEATWIADRLGAEVVLIPDAGHYPHSERADLVAPAVLEFARRVTGA